mmetsp:Transcript_125560/g.250497  ORF Transcript_125560/g.250497 Transcript_125560/m.250497 type:complete len:279 (-) Transcript_125560:29-865(-)
MAHHTSVAAAILHLMFIPFRGFALRPEALEGRREHDSKVELVVNAWKEDLGFIDSMFTNRIPSNTTTVYCNGLDLKDRRCIRVANYGTENWVYLNHIVENYDQLAEITVFTIASITSSEWDWLKCRKLNYVLSKLDTADKQSSFPGFATMAHTAPGMFLPWDAKFDIKMFRHHVGGMPVKACRPSVAPLGNFYKSFLGQDVSWPKSTGIQFNGIFATRKEMIHQHPKSLYQSLRAELERCGEDVELVADHYMERLWKPMLDRDGVDDTSGENACPIRI